MEGNTKKSNDGFGEDTLNPGQLLAGMKKSKTYNCVVCSSEFTAKDKRALYCSNKCKQAAKYSRKEKEPIARACRRCGTEMITNDKRFKYCSDVRSTLGYQGL